jgi:DNA gyrase subunit B
VSTVAQLRKLLSKPAPESEPFDIELLSEEPTELRVRAVERKTGLAQTHRLRSTLFDSNDYEQFLRVHHQLVELAGTPPFTVRLGDNDAEALSFEELRRCVLQVASKGVKLQRFKGLGEMNAEQLGETTMNAESRTLQQVTMEDAFTADELFAKLMGDQVEPRRQFIETYAKSVTNLDV